MTSGEFNSALTSIAEKYIGALSSATSEAFFKSEVVGLIAQFYACGGLLCDREGIPMQRLEDVEITVSRGPHSMSVSTMRKNPSQGLDETKPIV